MIQPLPLERWWRQPRWAQASLVAILVVAAVLLTWNLARGGDFGFYEASARSMSESWKALLFGTFDPAATVTLDKLSGFAVPQALGIRLFGMSTSSVALPQVIEGLVTVLACAVVGLRAGGRGLGLVAAAAASSTPIFVSMFAHPMEDGLLTMSLAVALVWWQRAVLTDRWWPLLVAALFVGIGFQAKMMSAWFILPGLIVATIVAGAPRWRRATGRALVFAGTAVVASLAWMAAIALTPAGTRPFVDGSTDDDIFAMVFGYNGIDRIVPNAYPGAVGSHAPVGGSPAKLVANLVAALGHVGGGSVDAPASGQHAALSMTKLLEMPLVSQIGWLYPLALAGIVLGLVRWWPRRTAETERRTPADRAMFALLVALTLWLALAAAVLSVSKIPHTAYVAGLGVQLAVLAAIAWKEATRLLRSPRLSARLVAPALILLQGVWAAVLAMESRMPWVLVAVAGAAFLVGLALTVSTPVRPLRAIPIAAARWRRSVPALFAVALLAAPAAFSAQVIDASRDGSGGDASVGITSHADAPFAPSVPALWGGLPAVSTPVAQLIHTAQRDGGGVDGHPLVVTDSTMISAEIITSTGDSVYTDGGYSQHTPVFTEDALRALVRDGTAHLFVVTDPAIAHDPVRALVSDDHCQQEKTWQIAAPGSTHHDGPTSFSLYTCS